uniref:Uncharacterized protein n=1 Tax=Anguilla anguilla TaxID=7936 RepID=A0A0E9V4W2_ANGAN
MTTVAIMRRSRPITSRQ